MGYAIKGSGRLMTPDWLTSLQTADRIGGENSAYRLVPLVYRAFRLRCDSLASVPAHVYRGDEIVPWPLACDYYQLIWLIEASLMMAGRAFAEVAANKVVVKDLIYRNPYEIDVHYQDKTYEFVQPSAGAHWRNVPGKRAEMFYMAEYDPAQDVLPGVGAVQVALEAARLRHYLSRFAGKFFESGAMPVVMLGTENLQEGEAKRVEKWFKTMATSIRNAWNVIALKGKITPAVLTPPLNQLAIPELYEQSIQDIAWAFGMNKAMLTDTANFATAQEYGMQFWQGTIRPRGAMIENALNNQVFKYMGLRLGIAFEELDVFQQDESQRAGSLAQLTTAGVPLLTAMEILGYDLSKEQKDAIEEEKKKKTPEQLRPFTGEEETDSQSLPETGKGTEDAAADEMKRWERFVLKRMKDGKTIREFETEVIHPSLAGAISGALEQAKSAADVRGIFANASLWRNYP